MNYAEDDVSGRRRLSLQPRGLGTDQSPSLSSKASKPSPFGTARPREQVIAEREGKKETEVLKEQAQKEWKPSIVLTEAQREEKKAVEAELAFAKSELSKEFDPMKSKALNEEVVLMEKKLGELLENFEKLAIQAAQTGAGRRIFERRREDERTAGAAVLGGDHYIADGQDNYSNFSRGRDREVEKGGSYGDTWRAKGGGGGGGRLGGSQCFKCGEMGHFSRECPAMGGTGAGRGSYGSSFGGGRGGGRQCYTCGQEGHFSRECPQSGGGYGSQGAVYGGNNYGGTYFGGSGAPDLEGGSYSFSKQGGVNYFSGDGYDDRYVHGGAAGRARGCSTSGRQDGYGN